MTKPVPLDYSALVVPFLTMIHRRVMYVKKADFEWHWFFLEYGPHGERYLASQTPHAEMQKLATWFLRSTKDIRGNFRPNISIIEIEGLIAATEAIIREQAALRTRAPLGEGEALRR